MGFGRTLVAWTFVVLVAGSLGAGAAPKIFWTSEPVRPDETVLLQGSDLGGADAVVEMARIADGDLNGPALPEIKDWERVPVLQGGGQSLKFVVPAKWRMGIFAVRVTAGGATTEAWRLNMPDSWWVQGDEGDSATPGGWLRIMGKSLAMGGGPVTVRLQARSDRPNPPPPPIVTLTPVEADEFSLKVKLPADLEATGYAVMIHNGAGGAAGWRGGLGISVKPAPVTPAGVFSVLESYGPDAAAKMRESLVKYSQPVDRTEGIAAALKKAKENGGGVVYFPAGRYTVKGTINVPDHTVLRGEGQGLVTLWWGTGHFNLDGGGDKGRARPEGEPKPPSPLIAGADWGIEDLSLYLPVDYEQCLVADRRFRMARVKVRIDHYWLVQGRGNGTVARMGRNFQVTDCDILAKGDGLVCGDYGVIARNKIASNKSNTPLGNSRQVIVEQNRMVSMDPTAYQNIAGVGRNIYYGQNLQEAFYGHQSDYSFTFDASSGAYIGKVAAVAGTRVTLAGDPAYPKWAPEGHKIWRRGVVSILDGRGAGQWRDVVANAGRSWEIDRPFDVAPDATSVVTITPFNGRVLIVGNRFEDANWVNAGYGISIDVVCARNQIVRCANVMNYGVHSQDWYQPSWFVQYFDNVIGEGQTGIGSNGSGRSSTVFDGPLTCWAVHRRHTVAADNSGSISISGVLRDAIVEGCVLKNSLSVIKVDGKATGVLFRKNTFEGGEARYRGEGVKGAVVP